MFRARSGPTLPPTPLIEWHLTQPLAPKTREPASGSWLALNTGWADAPSNATSENATATAPITARIIGDPFCRGLGDRRENFRPTVADATRITAQSQQLLELQLQYAGRVGVTDLGIIEDGHPKGILLLGIGELDVVFAAGGELPPEHAGANAVLVDDLGRDIAAVSRERSHDDAGHFVAGLVLGVVERLLLAVDDPVGRRRLIALQRELRTVLGIVHVVAVAASGAGIALPAGFGCLVLVIACGVEVLVVDLADAPRAHTLHVPDVGPLAGVGQVLVAVGLALAGMAGGEA